jgi:hypothetical protein
LPAHSNGAQRASFRRMRTAFVGILAALVLVAGVTIDAPAAKAATHKVVIVVGPVGSATKSYKRSARRLADQARSYGAQVVEVYSPNATWRRVRSAARGANLLIYLGHGNGWPSPYKPFSTKSKDGMGLNRAAHSGNRNLRYYGEYYMARLDLAPHAVVALNRLCYASGNSEWGAANPSRSVAKKRVDNYGRGFIRAGAQAVFASGITSIGYVIKGLFTREASMTMKQLFWTDSNRTRTYAFGFRSRHFAGVTARMDPYAPNRYYRSVIGYLGRTVGDWRSG